MNLDTMLSKVKAYLSYRRQNGYALRIAGRQLTSFAQFADRSQHRGPLTVDLVSRWALANRAGLAITAARRIEVIRPFARYCQRLDSKTEIPPQGLFGPGHRRLTPHIYTEQEIGALLAASAHLSPVNGLRPITCATIFGLLFSTGLRISEATALRRQDVDLQSGILHIRQAKFGKSRFVPLHSSTTRALRRYASRRDQDVNSNATDAFFVFDHGRPALTRKIQYAFGFVCRRLSWHARGGHRTPRIHDTAGRAICSPPERISLMCRPNLATRIRPSL